MKCCVSTDWMISSTNRMVKVREFRVTAEKGLVSDRDGGFPLSSSSDRAGGFSLKISVKIEDKRVITENRISCE